MAHISVVFALLSDISAYPSSSTEGVVNHAIHCSRRRSSLQGYLAWVLPMFSSIRLPAQLLAFFPSAATFFSLAWQGFPKTS
jgi:hypothetical protein